MSRNHFPVQRPLPPKPKRALLIRLALTFSLSWLCAQIPLFAQEALSAKQTRWLLEHTHHLATSEPGANSEDLRFLDDFIGSARILGVGEGTHGSREFYRLKQRLFQYLAEHQGFKVFALEAGLAESDRLNAFIQGGDGDPAEVLAGLNEKIWNIDSFLQLVLWMRDQNLQHKAGLRFVGFDMKYTDQAVADILGTLRKLAPPLAKRIEAGYETQAEIEAVGIYPMPGITLEAELGSVPKAGSQVTLRGWLTARGLDRHGAGLWVRATGDQGLYRDSVVDPATLTESNAAASAEALTAESWQLHEVTFTVPPGTAALTYGVTHRGNGTVWFDSLELEVDGRRVQTSIDLDFEDGILEDGILEDGNLEHGNLEQGDLQNEALEASDASDSHGDRFRRLPLMFPTLQVSDYTVSIDPSGYKTGSRSLQIAYDSRLDIAVAQSWSVVRALAQAQFELEQRANRRDVFLLIQKAKTVAQAMAWRARRGNRDAMMAENLEWIIGQEAPDAKVFVSAANSHIGNWPNRMGEALKEAFGAAYLAVALTTFEGEYRAGNRQGEMGSYPLPGAPAGSLEQIMSTIEERPKAFLDLRLAQKKTKGSGWLWQPLPVRNVGSLAQDRQFRTQILPELYDGLVFLKRTTAARLP